jgi:hypothetical protein
MNWKDEVKKFKAEMKPEISSIATSYIRFGFFGSVGGGKSVTAGIFALGITPEGCIGWIDGEGKRSGFAIDQVAEMAAAHYGGEKQKFIERFKVIYVEAPFHPLKVVAAIETLEDQGCKTVIADIMSQAWDSDGGYLDLKNEELYKMAGEDEKKRERSAAAAAAHIKPWTHQKLVNKVNDSKCNMVLLFQAKQKYNAKSFKPDDFVTPIQESGLTRTALAVGKVEAKMVGETPQGGFCTFRGAIEQGTKYTHHSIIERLPKNGEQFKFEHAEAIAKWVNSPNPGKQTSAVHSALNGNLLDDLVKLTYEVHKGDKPALTKWLIEQGIISKSERPSSMTPERLEDVIIAVRGVI